MKGILSLEYLVLMALMLSLFALFLPITLKVKEKSSEFIIAQDLKYEQVTAETACETAMITLENQSVNVNLSRVDIECSTDPDKGLILAP